MNDIRRTLLFLRDKDRVLLAMKKRGFGEGLWNGVGGKVEKGETLFQALIRESEEEIYVTPKDFHQVAEIDFYGGATKDAWRMYCYIYVCDKWIGEPTESEEMAPQWYKISDIPFDKMWQDDKYWLPKVLEGKLVTGKFIFDENNNITDYSINEVTEFLNNE